MPSIEESPCPSCGAPPGSLTLGEMLQARPVGSHLHNTLVLSVKDTLGEIEAHDHPNAPIGDLYCLNLKAWLGEQMPGILRILGEAQAELDTMRARVMALADEATALLLAQHDQKEEDRG